MIPLAEEEISHLWDKEVSTDDDEDRRKKRLRATLDITENTEEADTTHGQSKTTTTILEATATENEREETWMIDHTNGTDIQTGDRRHTGAQTAHQESSA